LRVGFGVKVDIEVEVIFGMVSGLCEVRGGEGRVE